MFYQLHHTASSEYFKREEGENFSYPPHLHQDFELIILLEGKMKVSLNRHEHQLVAGEAILLFPNELHALDSELSRHVLFIFSEKLIHAFSVKYKDLVPQKRTLRLTPEQLSSLLMLNADSTIVALKGALYSFAALVESSGKFVPSFADKNDLLRKIFTFVDQNFHSECSLRDLSAALGYDYAYLSRYFKRVTGIPYNSYVNSCRLSNASYLLHNTDTSILACAIESGYRSLRSFNRNFKACFGMTPETYRTK